MTESKNDVPIVPKALPTVKQVKKVVLPIDENNLDHNYCGNSNQLSKERRNCNMSLPNKRDYVDVNKVAVAIDCTQKSIVKEEVIIPDLTEKNIDQNIHLDTSYSQINNKESIKKENAILISCKIKKKIHSSDNTKSCSEVDVNTSTCNNLKLFDNTIDKKQSIAQLRTETLSINDPIEITLEQYYNLSVLNSVPLILKLPISKPIQNKSVIQIDNAEKDNSIVHILNIKEKEIAITNNNFAEIKEEMVEADSEKQIANRNKRFYHVICLTCKKLKKPDDTSSRCKDCQNLFQYECLRCRDILSSKDEYYNHLKMREFCPEIQVPLFLKNDSYALATIMEKNQCSNNAWERAQKLVSVVKISRMKSIDSKFKRIKLCCPICDETYPVENGNFWCKTCDMSSVFKCQTCNRNYTTYCGAIYHTENHVIKKPIFECHECSFKYKKKRALFTHIHHKHLQKENKKIKPRKKVAQCSDCNLIIKSNSYWRKHEYSCRKKLYFKCPLCTEKYLVKEEMRLHLLAGHEKTDSQALELIKEIEDVRSNQEDKKKQRKQENLNRPKLRYITPYCIDCNKTYEHLKISNNNNCPKCKSMVEVQCKFCKKSFKKYMTAYYHITKKCEKIKVAKSKEKNRGLVSKITEINKHKKVKENRNVSDLSSKNQCVDFIFEDLLVRKNIKLENNTASNTEMHLYENIDIKVETPDIKDFNSYNYNLI